MNDLVILAAALISLALAMLGSAAVTAWIVSILMPRPIADDVLGITAVCPLCGEYEYYFHGSDRQIEINKSRRCVRSSRCFFCNHTAATEYIRSSHVDATD